MQVRVDLPARANLLGNPSDANEGDHAVVSLAVPLRAEIALEPDAERRCELDGRWHPLPDELPARAEGPARLVVAALDSLVQHSPEARERLRGRGFALRFRTEVPRGSGLGGSSLLVLGVLAALRAWLELDEAEHHPYRLAEWAQWAEEHEGGTAGGYVDFYVPLFGGLCYVDFRGKLEHPPEGDGPFATVERLDPWVPDPPLVVAFTGLAHDSGEVHGRMRPRYLAEHRGGGGALVDVMRDVGACAWLGKQALLRHDWEAVGRLMDRNHTLVDHLMRLCEFEDGAGAANNALISAARAAGALGAKLSGAGGGGSILALARPGAEAELESALREELERLDAPEGRTYRARVEKRGLRITRA
jgi:mevalonate kinase